MAERAVKGENDEASLSDMIEREREERSGCARPAAVGVAFGVEDARLIFCLTPSPASFLV